MTDLINLFCLYGLCAAVTLYALLDDADFVDFLRGMWREDGAKFWVILPIFMLIIWPLLAAFKILETLRGRR